MKSPSMMTCGIFALSIAAVVGSVAFICGMTSRETATVSPWISHPVVDVDLQVPGGSESPSYHCRYNFTVGENAKSLSFAGLNDTSILVRAVGRRTASLRIITAQKSMDAQVTAGTCEYILDDNRKIKLAFLSSTLPPYDELIQLSDNIDVFRHYHVEPIEERKVVPVSSTEESLRNELLNLLKKMLTEPHGWEGFDSRGQGYEIDIHVDGQPVHIELTFRSGWIVINDPQGTRYYGFHPDRFRQLHIALDQYLAVKGFDPGVGPK